ncbi:(4Fe-4S)-binding protein [Patulibacter sp.]|uniref:(4Fe-4S)-binding protein n=1 Tax=Patulibacter sp. TaxID=1912859 RepID=UPI00271E513E|nr:(4Fe-4S)-binding protein [Patulibacter sp.]MDO9407734.1 (4Fe-4S)-binding protein [Patulibacter sp.]
MSTQEPVAGGPPAGVRSYALPDGRTAVTFEAALCRHAAECVRGLPAVFDTSKRPWIQPDRAPADAVVEVVGRCPTRALKIVREGDAGADSGG